MTAGYDPSRADSAQPGPAAPRYGGYAAPAGSQPAVPSQSVPPQSVPPQVGGQSYAGGQSPYAAGQPSYGSGQSPYGGPYQYPPVAPAGGAPTSAAPASAVPTGGLPAAPGQSGPPVAPGQGGARPAGGRLGTVTFALAAFLLVVALVEGVFLIRLDGQVDDSRSAATKARSDADNRLKALEARADGLEQKVGKTLDAPGVAAAVLPSVFRVSAGKYTGTAFAIGKDGSGTDLITNYHVVDSVYKAGTREVYLERTNGRFPAKIMKVDEKKDLALLHTEEKFARLAAATEQVKPGEPIVVVGAPYGLEDTVTAGVVSALRGTEDPPTVQFDAPINPGNSGGPVINAQKQVIGVATAKANGAEGIGVAIQIAVVCRTFGVC